MNLINIYILESHQTANLIPWLLSLDGGVAIDVASLVGFSLVLLGVGNLPRAVGTTRKTQVIGQQAKRRHTCDRALLFSTKAYRIC